MFRPSHSLLRPVESGALFPSSFGNLQTFPHSNLPTCPRAISFRIRTYAKRAPNSFRIRTYKTQDLKSFRIRTYKKRGRGEAPKAPCNAGLPRANSRYTTGFMLATTVLDTNWMGRSRSIGAVLLESDGHRAVIDPGPASTLGTLRGLLDARGIGVSDLNAILLTHIHLDHAGATGALIRENPNLEVYVHKAGMLHMADPSKLLASAERLWPGELQHLFGETLPVPFGNLRMLKGGETLALGSRNLDVVYTPGHAAHHVSYFDSSDGTAFVGDTTGFHIEGEPYAVPLAPPPDIDLEIWNASLDAIATRHPARLFLTHYGYSHDPAAHIAEYRKNIHRWAALAADILRSAPDERAGVEAFVAATSAEIQKRVTGADAEHYIFNCGLNLTWLGLARYHRKRAEAAAASQPQAEAPAKPN
jgi:glyoxylase-like metal-dependent hydrolase (beta-lactamase superfamily II)